MFNLYFDRALGEYLLRYSVKYKVLPQKAIWHQSVLSAAEQYWKDSQKNLSVADLDMRIGAGGGQEPWTYFNQSNCGG